MDNVINVFKWILIAIYTVAFGIPATVVSLLAPDLIQKYCVRPWSRMILLTAGVKVRIEGLENLPNEPCVIMFNHQSYFDIFAFASVLPIEWRALMKVELLKVPFVGWVAKASGHHFINRDNSIKSMREIEKIAEKIRNGHSVVIAPEGTRSEDGKLLPFKPGGFVLAIRSGTPVVPMVIDGGSRIMPTHSLKIKSGEIKITILPQIEVESLPTGKPGRELLMKKVREAFESKLDNAGTESQQS